MELFIHRGNWSEALLLTSTYTTGMASESAGSGPGCAGQAEVLEAETLIPRLPFISFLHGLRVIPGFLGESC